MLLVIHKNQSSADTVSDIFNFMGILSYGTTPEHLMSVLSNRYRAVLFVHPERISAIKEIVQLVKSFSLDAPVFAISKKERYDFTDKPDIYSLFDKVLPDGSLSSKLIYEILTYQNEAGRVPIGTYRLAGIDVSVNKSQSTYFDEPVNLTKTEAMILRFLIASYPIAQNTREILKYSFKRGKTPEPSSIRTHVSSINKKFTEVAKKRIISREHGKGYTIAVN